MSSPPSRDDPRGLSFERVDGALRGSFGRPLRFFDEIGSTNTEALAWAAEGAPEGALVVANHQTEGRGRWGRRWFSKPGALLQFSLVLRPDLSLDRYGLLGTMFGVAVADSIESLAGLETRIKWPNDVTVGGRKLCGMLIESVTSGPEVAASVVGIGMNVDLRSDDLPPEIADTATSIATELVGNEAPRAEQVLAEVLARAEDLYPLLQSDGGIATLLERAAARSEVIGRDVTIRFSDGRSLDGRALRLTRTGALELEVDGGREVINVGEIARLRAAGGGVDA